MRPGGAAATRALSGVRPTAADLAYAAQWEGAERGAARLRRRLLLRHLAATALGAHADVVQVAREPGGRPVVVAPVRLHASVARSGEWAALALHAAEVGVDLEAADTTPDWSLFPPGARAALGDAELAFVGAWTAREAYLKATGAGLAGAGAVAVRCATEGLEVVGPAGVGQAQRRAVADLLATTVIMGTACAARAGGV